MTSGFVLPRLGNSSACYEEKQARLRRKLRRGLPDEWSWQWSTDTDEVMLISTTSLA